VGSFAEREPNISSQLGVAERSALSEASAASLRKEISQTTRRYTERQLVLVVM
jgi:hypothetical protein